MEGTCPRRTCRIVISLHLRFYILLNLLNAILNYCPVKAIFYFSITITFNRVTSSKPYFPFSLPMPEDLIPTKGFPGCT